MIVQNTNILLHLPPKQKDFHWISSQGTRKRLNESWFQHFWVSLSVHNARTLRNCFTAFLYPPLQKQCPCYCKFLPDQFFWVSKAHASITPLVLLYGRWHCAYLTGTSGVNVYSSYKKLNLLKYYSWELRKIWKSAMTILLMKK